MMKIDIQYSIGGLGHTSEADIERRLILALSKVEPHISSIIFIISQIEKNDGHLYQHCSLTISLNRIPDILIEETQKGLNSAINRVIQKATRIISRKILLGKGEGL
ncbi:hypothetical protein [Colwellia sp. C1TZA3]|uniref:hypothetical protein n=1 Tax=Colwellia sp. C1TZA3 TaxID=2508879 RepID=UPI0011B9B111|nr:hypothetical protein [Colwellia sp. C1TZA3]TWX73453.1 hypothetical protein ESZ39_04135 [Colwellia sp. C1TZA3]